MKRLIWLLCLTLAAPSRGQSPLPPSFEFDQQAGDSIRQLKQLSAELPELGDEVDRAALAPAWPQKSQKILEEVFRIHELLVEQWARAREAFQGDDAAFAEDMIKKGKVSVQVRGLGVGELNMIDDAPFVRVVHEGSEIAFMLYEEGAIDPDSEHLRTYLARQHIDAGAARVDGQAGRDVVMIAKGKGPLQRAQLDDPSRYLRSDRARAWRTPAWWRDYWKATYRPSTKATWGFGTACGLSQGGLALCVAGLKAAVNPEAAMDFTPGFLSGAWGTGIGAYVNTYKNWTNRGSTFMRTVKSSLNGGLFGYALIVLSRDDDDYESLSIFDPQGLMVHATVIGNVVANNFAKTHWNDFARVREYVGISRRDFEMKLPWGSRWRTGVSQSAVESQAIYLAPFSIRLLDLVHFTVGSFPLGKFVLWTSIPFVEFAVLRYTEKLAERTQHPKAFELAADQRRAWELKKRMMWDFELMRGQALRVWARIRGDVPEQNALNRWLHRKYPDLIKREVLASRATNSLEAFDIPSGSCSQSLGSMLR